jgi:hypothetical protein
MYTNFIPHYVSYKSPTYDASSSDTILNCLGSGKYCHGPRYDLGIQDGKDILLEDLRQKCTWKIAYETDRPNLYWEYMISFYENCYKVNSFTEKCSYELLDINAGISNIEECLVQSFKLNILKSVMVFTNDNLLLDDDYDVKNKWGIRSFPTLMVNNKTIHSDWSGEVLFEAICAGFIRPPAVCIEKAGFGKHIRNKSDASVSYTTISFIIVTIISLNIVLVMLCKRYIVKRITARIDHVDIDNKINNVVSSYLALRESK